MHPPRPLLVALMLLTLLAPGARAQRPQTRPAGGEKPWPRVGFQEVLDGPTYIPTVGQTRGEAGDCIIDLTSARDGSGRLFLVTRRGVIYTMKDNKFNPEPFLDISSLTSMQGERGLLSMAFPPDYKTKGVFYVYYTDGNTSGTPRTLGDILIARYKVDPKNPDKALRDSGEILLRIEHRQYSNHDGGQLQFGPDGMLYISTGDGGSGYDPFLAGQNLGTMLGKVLRIDVEGKPDPGKAYRVPPENPFVTKAGALPEIWALGLRNAWRMSFDRANGDLYIGNVGQVDYEQIYYIPGASKGGENFGWSVYEGTHDIADMGTRARNRPNLQRNASQKLGTDKGITFPVAEFSHETQPRFISITGGYVYRAKEFPSWDGVYFFSDWGHGDNTREIGQIWALRRDENGRWETRQVDDNKTPVRKTTAFGIDEPGNIYVLSFGDSKVYKLIERPEGP